MNPLQDVESEWILGLGFTDSGCGAQSAQDGQILQGQAPLFHLSWRRLAHQNGPSWSIMIQRINGSALNNALSRIRKHQPWLSFTSNGADICIYKLYKSIVVLQKVLFLNEASKWPIGSWNQNSQQRLKSCPGGSGYSSPSTESYWGLFGASLEWTLEISQYSSLISIVNLCTTAYKDQPAWAQSNLPWERPLVARAQSIQCKSHCCAVYSHFQSSGEERAQLPSQSGCKCVAAWLLTMIPNNENATAQYHHDGFYEARIMMIMTTFKHIEDTSIPVAYCRFQDFEACFSQHQEMWIIF